jgi:hypothetical protein
MQSGNELGALMNAPIWRSALRALGISGPSPDAQESSWTCVSGGAIFNFEFSILN